MNIWISKVKGHATDTQVEEGLVLQCNKAGNDPADDAATIGLRGHSAGLTKLGTWLTNRHTNYTTLMHRVPKLILKEDTSQRKDMEEAGCEKGMTKRLLHRPYAGPMSYGKPDLARTLTFLIPPRGVHTFHKHQVHLDQIWTFLSSKDWALGDEAHGIEISWLELLLIFEVEGH